MTTKDIKALIKAINNEEAYKISDLVNLLKLASDVYYNDGDDLSPKLVSFVQRYITDKVFDSLVTILRDRSPNNAFLRKIGAPISNAMGRKIKLPFYMPSLDKATPDSKTLEKFLLQNKEYGFVISEKIDGISLGILPAKKFLCTRGDGLQGQNISHLWNDLNIPHKLSKDIMIRAEIVMPKNKFKKYEKSDDNPKGFVNSRNMVSGLVNKAANSSAFEDTLVLTYQVVGVKPSQAFKQLEALGFDTPWYKLTKSLTVAQLQTILLERKKKAKYDMDGLVISANVVERTTSGNPKKSVAFKDPSAIESGQTVVKEIVWQVSKHGKLTPVLLVEPIKLSGVTVKRATAHNAKYVVDNCLGPGAVISLRRSGEVIPFVEAVIKPAKKASLPKEKYSWNKTGVDIILDDVASDEILSIKLANFFKVIGVQRVAKGIFNKLYEDGLTTPAKVIKASKSRLMKIEGIQEKSATIIYDQIHEAISSISIPDLLFGSGCFTRELGPTLMEQIALKVPHFMKLKDSILQEQIEALPGFSSTRASAFVTGLPKFKKFYSEIEDLIHIKKPKKEAKPKSNKLSGMSIVETGLRLDDSVKQVIQEHGGIISNSVTKDTSILVVKNKDTSSSKAEKARKLGVKIYSLKEFEIFLRKKLK
jgi:NAD-dependent DNA ligase